MAWSLPPTAADALFFVGQNPGLNEDQAGEPFVGPSGQLVREVFAKGNRLHERCAIYLGNAVRCFTLGNEVPPNKSMIACSPYLLEDIRLIRARHPGKVVIVSLGAVATGAVWRVLVGGRKRKSLVEGFKSNGALVEIEGGGVALFSTFHPAYILRDKNKMHPTKDHLALVSAYLDGTLPGPSKPDYHEPRYPITGD